MLNLHAGTIETMKHQEQNMDDAILQDSNWPLFFSSAKVAEFFSAPVLAVRRASDSLKNVTMLLNLNNDPDRKGNSGGNGGTTSGMTSPTFKDSNNNDDPPRKGNSGGPGGSASGRSSPLFTRVRNLTQGIWNPEFLQQLVEASACTVGAEVNLQL